MPRLTAALLTAGLIVIGLTAGSSTATFSGKNGRIIFTRGVGNHNEIFSANPDGSHQKQLTVSKPRGSVSFESDWSPDGGLIAFDSDRRNLEGRTNVQIYTMTAAGGDVTQLTRGAGFHGTPAWSPTGATLAISADWAKERGIWLIPSSDPDGVTVDEAVRITDPQAAGAKFDDEPQFSPDGSTIFFSRFKAFRDRKSAIFRINADGSGEKQLTNYRLNASHPDVSPDGRWITFDSGDAGAPGSEGEIYLLRSDGSGKKQALTSNPPVSEDAPFVLSNNPSFSPNGRRIIFTQFQPPGSALVVMKTDGSKKHEILGGSRFPNKADWGTHP